MKTYVALLRGVNVSGHNKLPMAELRRCLSDLGYRDVTTYIQSGNVVFKASAPEARLAHEIGHEIRRRFGFIVPVVLRTNEQLKAISANNPFLRRAGDAGILHVTFLAEKPAPARVKALAGGPTGPDDFVVKGRDVYLRCPNGYGRSKLTNAFFEKRLGTGATTRNWKTVLTLLDLASQ